MKFMYSSVFLMVLLVLSSCTLYQKPKIPSLVVPDNFKVVIKVSNPKLNDQWWKNFHDQQLNQLVDKAIKSNLNYQIAIKNIEISKSYVVQAASSLYPQINLNYDASRIKLSKNAINTFSSAGSAKGLTNVSFPLQNFSTPFTSLEGFLSTTFEVDVWNQVHNSVNQAKANVIVSIADSNVIKLTLISNVVDTYFQIRALKANQANLQRQIYFADEILKLTRSQYKGGLVDGQSIYDAKNQIETIKINLSSLEKQKEILINSMAYLLGQYPEHFKVRIQKNLKFKSLSELIPRDIPANVLSRRPDIREAFYQIVSYGYLEKQNIANFLPSFNLTGNWGYSSPNLGNFISNSSIFWNYGANILQPILDFGLRMSEYKRSKYQFEAALLNYKNIVINAFSEVDNALSSYQKDNIALQSYKHQSTIYRDKLRMYAAQYRGGLADNTNFLTTSLSSLQNEYNVTSQQAAVLQDVVQLYKTLGLGLGGEYQKK